MTNERAHALTQQFEAANQAVIAFVEQCSEADWQKASAEEQWPVGVTARHIAVSCQGGASMIGMMVNGEPLTLTLDMLDQRNAQHAKEHANCSKSEVLDLLHNNGTAAAKMVSELSEKQLERTATFFAGTMNVQQAIENVLIGHMTGHFASLKATVSA